MEPKKNEKENDISKEETENRSDQLNPNNDVYWQSRGLEKRPDDWKDRIEK